MISRVIARPFYKNQNFTIISRSSRYDYDKKFSARLYSSLPSLTPQEVTKILRVNEFTKEYESSSSIKYYESNQLAANNPIEDTRSEARCLLTNGFLSGIFDGHGGSACAQVVAKRLFSYVSACLLPPSVLTRYMNKRGIDENLRLLERYNDKMEFASGIKNLYEDESFAAFLRDLVNEKNSTHGQIDESLVKAFLRLDADLSNEELNKLCTKDAAGTLSMVKSGAVAVVAHIDGRNLHVAGVGTCGAVLGTHTEDKGWSEKLLTVKHNSENPIESEKIESEHPTFEESTVLHGNLLLGQLEPLRALGNFRFKWSKELMKDVVIPYLGEAAVPRNYHTPPYLSARPDVTYHKLCASDKFLILASDGLWNVIDPYEAVLLVAEHMNGKIAQNPVKYPGKNMKLSENDEFLLQGAEGGLRQIPVDGNAATYLLRNALGGIRHGFQHNKLSKRLTLPSDRVRRYRDDITITVVYMNTDFLENSAQ